ncbi:S-layer homology domain-containing protein [Paenibacillus sp. P36]|uniref:S-layer homology domain-containing protein n=1 Tax=Paenibacillus sp. P36 TaxID=3342538 RepID=UPI0038B3C559
MKKYIAAIMALLFVLSPVSARAAASFTLALSVDEVQRGGEIQLSGTVTNNAKDVVVKIIRPNQTTFYINAITPVQGSYTAKVTIPDDKDFAPFGLYQVVAGSDNLTETKTFKVIDPNGGGTDPGNPTDPTDPGNPTDPTDPGNPTDPTDPGNPTDPTNPGNPTDPTNPGNPSNPGDTQPDDSGSGSSPTDPTTIPTNAGKTADGIVQPEKSTNGRYLLGSETLNQAIQQAKDSVTVQLPAATGDEGTALEFPAKSLQDLKDKNLDLILTYENSTVRFPANAISASGEQQSRIRIDLNTALTSDAKNLLNQSLQSNPDYKSTGVILSVEIKLITGDNAVEIHHLDKPAVVTMKLTEEQEKAIRSDLAGVYHVDGAAVEYVGGTVSKGTFTFTAEHFSYYTILEYNKMFADLAGHWAAKSVQSLTAKHIVEGVDEQHYEPNRSITRAEFVTLLMRALKWSGHTTPQAGSNPFSDVAANAYYTEQVIGAASLGIVSGYNGAFRPNDIITREEAVVALVQAAKYFNVVGSNKAEPAFADTNDISSWAAAAVKQAWSKGLIEGDGARFNPKSSVTRAEVAVMITRLLPNGSL